MIFPTIEFAAFFLVVLTVSWLLMPRPQLWKPFMVAASYVFYAYADWRFLFLIIAVTLVNQAAATAVFRAGPGSRPAGRLVKLAVVADLGLLGWFKYYGFFVHSIDDLLDRLGLGSPLPLLQIALPVGISFFTFQAISYVVDVHRGHFTPACPIDFAVFQAFFPHLVAGPIVRAREFIPQLATPRDPRIIPAGPALFLITGGLVKKIVIADLIGTRLVDPVFASPGAHSGTEVLVAVYGYAVQIYCDFSAYTDMAIGLALLLGFRFPQNFDRPYRATSLQDFWRRWHMTLSRWLRDYLYIPLGGNRGGRVATYRNLLLTMLLGGLWHGAAWTFVIWGGIHGGGLAIERWWREVRAGQAPPPELAAEPAPELAAEPAPELAAEPAAVPATVPGLRRPQPVLSLVGALAVPAADREYQPLFAAPEPVWVARRRQLRQVLLPDGLLAGLVTFHVVCLAWVFFRAPDLATAIELLSRLAHPGAAPLLTEPVLLAIVVGLGVQFVPERVWTALQERFTARSVVVQGLLLGLLLVLIDAIVGEQGVAPFLYFRF